MTPRPSSTLHRVLASDLLALLLLVALHHLIQVYLTDFLYFDREKVFRWAAVIHSTLPSVMAYAACRLVFPNIFSVLLVSGTSAVVSLINQQKQTLINEVLAWTDLANVHENLSVAAEFVGMVARGARAGIDRDRGHGLSHPACRQAELDIAACKALGARPAVPLAIHTTSGERRVAASTQPDQQGAVRKRPRLRHIKLATQHQEERSQQPPDTNQRAQGSTAPFPQEQVVAEHYAASPPPQRPRAKTIIVILCEACWNDKDHLTDVFDPLKKLGFKELRAVSPSYGGGTANAPFEILTGLPANNVLTGVVYQEYASLMRNGASTLASGLRAFGYRTVAAHNYRRQFWHRHEVKPKFGFDRFIAIEDMNIHGNQKRGWIDDRFLYESVQETLAQNQPTFLYLTTMYTHAPFRAKGSDQGIGDYTSRLHDAVARLTEFLAPVVRNSDATVMVYGDHKPLITQYFVDEKIFTPDMFVSRGLADDAKQQFVENVDQNRVGDMPVLIFDSDTKRVDAFIQAATHLPYYCLSHQFNQHFLGLNLPAFAHANANQTCVADQKLSYTDRRALYPSWLYRASLF